MDILKNPNPVACIRKEADRGQDSPTSIQNQSLSPSFLCREHSFQRQCLSNANTMPKDPRWHLTANWPWLSPPHLVGLHPKASHISAPVAGLPEMLTEVIGCQSYREPEGSGWETEVWGKGTGPRSPGGSVAEPGVELRLPDVQRMPV